MSLSSIDAARAKAFLIAAALAEGFSRARVLAPFRPEAADGERARSGQRTEAPSALVVALPYGNLDPDGRSAPEAQPAAPGGDAAPDGNAAAERDAALRGRPIARLDLFSRRGYYGETVARLKRIASRARAAYGGSRSDYRVYCNSPIPEKPLAAACGLGVIGRNTLLITPEAGSLVVIGILALPFPLDGDPPLAAGQPVARQQVADPCESCAACAAACPTGALGRAGSSRTMDRERCIQHYASRPGEVPESVARHWGDRLYGCSACRDACPANARPIVGADVERGVLPEAFDAAELAAAEDQEIAERFKGTALGMGWLGPAAIRRNARLALERGPRLKS